MPLIQGIKGVDGKMKILLFEGIDKVGKTTTIERLENTLSQKGYNVIKINVPFSCKGMNVAQSTFRLKLTVDNIVKMNEQFDDTYICLIDRLHISERVYGTILRYGNFDNFQCNLCDYKLKSLDTTLIYIQPTNIFNNFAKFSQEDLIDGLTYKQYTDTYIAFEREVQESLISKKIIITTEKLNELEKFLGGI